MSEKISNKMTSALLAMSLSYYFVMGEHVEKEMRRTDEILSTLLNWSTNDSYLNVTEGRKGNNSLYRVQIMLCRILVDYWSVSSQ